MYKNWVFYAILCGVTIYVISMIILLNKIIQHSSTQHASLQVHQRLPHHVAECGQLDCHYTLSKPASDYFLFHYVVTGELKIICQRCLQVFLYTYHHEAPLALCANEAVEARLSTDYETLVCDKNKLDLLGLLTDDLHLFVPESHADRAACSEDIKCHIQMSWE